MSCTAYRINEPSVIHQEIEGEVVVIHLETGTYYSLTQSAAWIWLGLAKREPVAQIAAGLPLQYDVPAPQACDDLVRFLADAKQEGLIVPLTPEDQSLSPDNSNPIPTSRRPYTAPAFQKFTDMQQLLLLDPIHEVDELGWPHQPANGKA